MRTMTRSAVTSATLACALLLVAGCGGSDSGSGDEEKSPPKTASGTVEQLARKATCDPDMQIDARELRQGICKTEKGRYVLTTFATYKGQQDWLSEAQAYGGSYLVGKKWVAVGDEELLGTLRGRLGGEVETAPSHGGAGADSGSTGDGEHEGHEGHHKG